MLEGEDDPAGFTNDDNVDLEVMSGEEFCNRLQHVLMVHLSLEHSARFIASQQKKLEGGVNHTLLMNGRDDPRQNEIQNVICVSHTNGSKLA